MAGWPLDDASPFTEAPFVVPFLKCPYLVGYLNGAGGLTFRTVQQSDADDSIPRHFCKAALVSGTGALEIGSDGFTAGTSKGCFWVVVGSAELTKDVKLTDTNADAAFRAAASRGALKHAVATVAQCPEAPLSGVHVMGVNMKTTGAASLFPKWLDWYEKLHRLRGDVEAGFQRQRDAPLPGAGGGVVAVPDDDIAGGGLFAQVQGLRSVSKLAEGLHALAAAQLLQSEMQTQQSGGGDAHTRQLRAQARNDTLQRLAARMHLGLSDAKLWAHPYAWICVYVQGANVKVDYDLLTWVGNLERQYETAPGSGYVDVLYAHAKRHSWVDLFNSCTKESSRRNPLQLYEDADVLAPLVRRVPLDAREMEKAILQMCQREGVDAEVDRRRRAILSAGAEDTGIGPLPSLVHTTPRSSPSHVLLDYAADESGVYDLAQAPATIGRMRDDPADTPDGWWQEVVARVERAAADASPAVSIHVEAPRRKAADDIGGAKVAKVEKSLGAPPHERILTRFEVFNSLPEAQQGRLRASDLVGFHTAASKRPQYRAEHCSKCDFFGHNDTNCEGLEKALYVWRSANGSTAILSEWAQQNLSRLRPVAPPTARRRALGPPPGRQRAPREHPHRRAHHPSPRPFPPALTGVVLLLGVVPAPCVVPLRPSAARCGAGGVSSGGRDTIVEQERPGAGCGPQRQERVRDGCATTALERRSQAHASERRDSWDEFESNYKGDANCAFDSNYAVGGYGDESGTARCATDSGPTARPTCMARRWARPL
eukprot:gene17494-15858_t